MGCRIRYNPESDLNFFRNWEWPCVIFKGWWHRRHSIQFFAVRTATVTWCTSTGTTTRVSGTGTTTDLTTTSTPTTRLRCLRNSFHFSSALAGEFCLFRVCSTDFVSWPFQPPSILPISSIGPESAMYFLLSRDFVSQSIINIIFKVSTLRMATRTYGCFSCRERKLAMTIASILSTKRLSILWPIECRWAFGSVW